MKDLNEKDLAVRYLLGDVSDAEREAVEDRFFADADFSEFLDAAETDLIDDYARGELGFDDRRRFETHFLITDARRERVRAAAILGQKLTGEKQIVAANANSFWHNFFEFFRVPNLALAGGLAAVALILFGGVWFFNQTQNRQTARVTDDNSNSGAEIAPQISPVAAPTVAPTATPKISPSPANAANANKPTTAPKPSVAPPMPNFAALVLTPMTRSSDAPDLILTPEIDILRLQLVNDDAEPYLRYRLVIRSPRGAVVFSQELSARANQKLFVLQIPAKRLAVSGSYEVTVTGSETVGGTFKIVNFYNFSLQKK